MKIIVLVEGNEKKIFKHWIPYVNPNLSYITGADITKLVRNSFLIVLVGGHSKYEDFIKNAVEDINNHGAIDRFVVCVASEDLTYDEKYEEINLITQKYPSNAETHIVIQHFCFETWALGNKRVFSRNPQDPIFRKYKMVYNVFFDDPEEMPEYSEEDLNRSQFAYKYLKKMLNEKNIRYTKSLPGSDLIGTSYFNEILLRYRATNHIEKFRYFIRAFT